MTEAQQMADKINSHLALGGKVWTVGHAGARGVGKAFCDGESLMIHVARTRKPVCLLPNYVTTELRREWRNLAFR